MAKKASGTGARVAPKAKRAPVKRKRPKPAASRSRTAKEEPAQPKANAADALVGLLESPLVADLLAAAISAAAATAIEHRLKKGRAQGSLVRAVGAAAAAAVGRQLAEELREMRRAAKETKSGK